MNLVLGLVFQAVGVIACRQARIVRRVPNLVINTVENAAQPPLPLPLLEQPFHPVTKLRLGDFTRIGRADGGDMVGVVQACLQERHLAIKLQAIDIQE
ncbi:hypothetical protein D3C75_1208400 [compost metagenome]